MEEFATRTIPGASALVAGRTWTSQAPTWFNCNLLSAVATPSWWHDRWAGNKMVPTEPRTDHRIGASRPAGHHARRVGAWLSHRLFCPLVASRRVQSSIIAQADTLHSYASPTASRTRAPAADRVTAPGTGPSWLHLALVTSDPPAGDLRPV